MKRLEYSTPEELDALVRRLASSYKYSLVADEARMITHYAETTLPNGERALYFGTPKTFNEYRKASVQ